jgi:FMN phosphatase YigB (HAD superfamily)
MTARQRSRKNRARLEPDADLPVIGCVIFDLDDTLYDCFAQRVRVCHWNAARAMVKAGLRANVEAVYRARMRAFREDPMLRHIDAEVCRKFQAADPDAISHASREAYFNCPVGKLTLFRGTLPLLRFLHSKGVPAFVVSFGEPKTQHAKVRALGLDGNPLIQRTIYADRDKLVTKETAFRQILEEVAIPSGQILVVGDRPMSEIRAGKELGMRTARILRGEFASQRPRSHEEEADYVVKSVSEIAKLPLRWRD